jgi:hypothetical protein
MKRLLQLVFVLFVAAESGYAHSDSPACANQLIAGVYRFKVQGTKLGGMGPVAATGSCHHRIRRLRRVDTG